MTQESLAGTGNAYFNFERFPLLAYLLRKRATTPRQLQQGTNTLLMSYFNSIPSFAKVLTLEIVR